MFSLYSSSQVGIFGSIIQKTNVEKILQLNCNATDFYGANDFPTYLYYNPYNESHQVNFAMAQDGSFDLYDALTHEYLLKNTTDGVAFSMAAKSARLIIVLPAGSKMDYDKASLRVDNKIVTYLSTK